MSGLMRLEERHKRCVELWIRGVPRDKIAEELGVARATIFVWMKDPLVQVYYEKLLKQIEAARKMRLTPTFFKAVEALELALDQTIAQLKSGEPTEALKAASVATITQVLEKVHRMERTDCGDPSQITETRTTDEQSAGPRKRSRLEMLLDETRTIDEQSAGPRKRSRLEMLLDEVVVEGEKIIEIEQGEPK